MQTIFLSKDTKDIPHDICHIYEHWLLMSFREYAGRQLNIDPSFIGSLSAETYKYLIFVECYFYHDKVTQLFNDFIAHEQLNDQLLDVSISQCACEERTEITFTHKADFNKYIDALVKLPWQNANKTAAYVYQDDRPKQDQPLLIKKTAKTYKSLGIELCLDDVSLEEQALFLRLYVIAQDIATAFLQGNGWYVQQSIGIRHEDSIMFTALSMNKPKNEVTNNDIKKSLEDHFKTVNVHNAMPYITAHFKEFAINPFLQGQPRDILHYTPVVAGNEMVASLATEHRIKQLFNNLSINVFNMSFSEAKELIY